MNFVKRLRDSLRLKKRIVVQATRPFIENAPTAELSPIEKMPLPAIAEKMWFIESHPTIPNQRRRALFYENDFYSRF